MAYQGSNISISLNKKRHRSFLKKIFAYFIFALFFVSLGILGLTKEQVKIKSVIIVGNHFVFTEDITKIVNNEVNTYYLWIIPTNNVLLLRRHEIKNKILENFKKIALVDILYDGFDKIKIQVTEREGRNLWCKGKPTDSRVCYFMDSDGFVFEEAPTFSSDTFPKYFGFITESDPIGRVYFKNDFKNISNLFDMLKKMSFEPKYFNALDEHEYEIYILGGGKILINDKKSFDSSLTNLQALIDSEYIENDLTSLPKIKYIDLRFGNKVNFELVK